MAVRINPYQPQVGTPNATPRGGDPRVSPAGNVGAALMDAAGGVAAIGREYEQKRREVEETRNAAWVGATLSEIQRDGARERLRLQQEAGPGGAGVVEGMRAWMQSRTDAALAAAPNDRSREFLRGRLLDYGTAQDLSAFEYETAEMERWTVGEAIKGVENAAAAAALQPDMAPTFMAEQLATVRGMTGISESVRARLVQDITETIPYHAAAAEVERDPRAALRSLNMRLGIGADAPVHEEGLRRESAEGIVAQIEAAEGRAIPAELRETAIAAAMSGDGFSIAARPDGWDIRPAAQESAGIMYDALPIPRVIELRNRALADIARQDAEAQKQREFGRVLYRDDIQNRIAASAAGQVVEIPPYGPMAEVLGEEEAILIHRRLEAGNAAAAELAGYDSATNEALAAVINAPPTGSDNYQNRRIAYEVRRERAEAIIAARKEDPGAYLIGTDTAVRSAYEAWAASPGDDAALRGYVLANNAAQERLGIVQPRLPKAMVQTLAETFNEGIASSDGNTVAGAAASLEFVANQMAVSDAALAELGEATGVLGRFAMDGVPGLAIKRLQAATAIPEAKLKELLPVEVSWADVETSVREAFAPMLRTFSAQGDDAIASRYLRAGQSMVAQRVANGEDRDDAAKAVYQELFASRNVVVDTYRVPMAYDADRVQSGLATYLYRMRPEDVEQTQFPWMTPDMATENGERLLRTIRSATYWVNDGAGEGVYLMHAGGPVMDASGKPIRVSFGEAAMIEPERRDRQPDVRPSARPGRE